MRSDFSFNTSCNSDDLLIVVSARLVYLYYSTVPVLSLARSDYEILAALQTDCVCVCVFSSHSFWTSSSLDVPAGVKNCTPE